MAVGVETLTMADGSKREVQMRKLLPMICQDGLIEDLTKAVIDSVDDDGVQRTPNLNVAYFAFVVGFGLPKRQLTLCWL